MSARPLPGRLGDVTLDGELPRRDDLGLIFDELDHQMACQAYLWALPLVSYEQWRTQHYDVFGATASDIVHYVNYQDRLGLITANATTPYVPDGFYLQRATGMNVMFGFRALDPDPARAQALVDAVRIYPYALRDDPPPTRVISPAGRPWTGDQPGGLAYWERLHDIIGREVADERDRFYMAMLRQLGIEKGRPFAPDDRMRGILEAASAAGELMAQANSFAKRFDGSRYWPDRQWDLVLALDNSAQRGDGYDELLERASWFYEAVSFSAAMKSQTPCVGQAYLSAYTDTSGDWLDGAEDYTLHVPADPPAKLFWSATVYDSRTRCLIDNDQQRGDRGSRDTELIYEDDGSVDLRFGPSAPAGREANWIQTIPGRHWFSYFRFYGPLEPYFDRTWKLGDITRSATGPDGPGTTSI